jgi:hypothetical protein
MKILFTALFLLIQNILSITVSENKLLQLDSSQEYIITKDCMEVAIPNNYKRLVLGINSTGVDNILMTDVRISNCTSEAIDNCCSGNSTFCIRNSLSETNEVKLNYCVDNTYIYACKSEQGAASGLKVSTKVVKGIGCTNTEFIAETECAAISTEHCKNQYTCLKQCSYVECRTVAFDNNTKIYSMCVPATLTMNDLRSRCKNHIAFENRDPEVAIQKCDKVVYVEDEKESSHKFFKLLLILFGTVVLITFISSIYYRFKINLDGNPPFEAPVFCPQFIYPRN